LDIFVVGAGHVGLVSAVGLARLGHRVTVADVDADRVSILQDGHAPVFEPGLADALRDGTAGGRLAFTTGMSPPAGTSFTFICVNTPTDAEGPLSTVNIEKVLAGLLESTAPEHTVVIRSTLSLGGAAKILRMARGRGARPAIVSNPEFMREGQALEDFDHPNRVVVGYLEDRDRSAAESVIEMYASLGAPSLVTDMQTAAIIKMLSNVYLGLKISFANEVARIASVLGADPMAALEGIGMDERIGTAFLRPGPGVGGSCLPEQAIAIALEAAAHDIDAPVLAAVHRSIAAQPRAVIERLDVLLGGPGALSGRRIALLGLAFKSNTDDVRESPALALATWLRTAGASVVAYDPRAEGTARRADPDLVLAPSAYEATDGVDAVLVATEWPEFGALDWTAIGARMRGDVVYDTRAIVDPAAVRGAGLRLERLGHRDRLAAPTSA
jgi:UDPglucose 6-dehydrogenase